MSERHDFALLADENDLEPDAADELAALTDETPEVDIDVADSDADSGAYDRWIGYWLTHEWSFACWGRKFRVWWTPTPVQEQPGMRRPTSLMLATAYLQLHARERDRPLREVLNAESEIARQVGARLHLPDRVAGVVGLPLHAARLALLDLANRMDADDEDPMGADLVRAVVAAQWDKQGTLPVGRRSDGETGRLPSTPDRGFTHMGTAYSRTCGLAVRRHLVAYYQDGRAPRLLEHAALLGTAQPDLYPLVVHKLLRAAVA